MHVAINWPFGRVLITEIATRNHWTQESSKLFARGLAARRVAPEHNVLWAVDAAETKKLGEPSRRFTTSRYRRLPFLERFPRAIVASEFTVNSVPAMPSQLHRRKRVIAITPLEMEDP